MENSIKNNLGMKISDFFIGMENSKLLSNMNIYENQGYIDIIDNDYNIKGRILIVSDKDYIKYITLEVASDLKFFKEEVIKKVLVDVVDVLNKKNNGELIDNLHNSQNVRLFVVFLSSKFSIFHA